MTNAPAFNFSALEYEEINFSSKKPIEPLTKLEQKEIQQIYQNDKQQIDSEEKEKTKPAITATAYSFKSKGYVGIMHLSSGRSISVRPKFKMSNAMDMIAAVTWGMVIPPELNSMCSQDELDHFMYLLSNIFVTTMKNTFNKYGCLKEYKDAQISSQVIKGRINFSKSIQQYADFTQFKMVMKTSELVIDSVENQVIKTAIHALIAILNAEEKDTSNVEQFNQLIQTLKQTDVHYLHGVSIIKNLKRIPAITFNGRNSHYKDIIKFSQLILDGVSPSLEVKETEKRAMAPSCLFFMPHIFEQYMLMVVKDYFGPRDFTVEKKSKEWTTTEDLISSRKGKPKNVNPDVVVFNNATKSYYMVMDAKYKLKGADAGDSYQMLAYMHTFQVQTAVLLVSSSKNGFSKETLAVGNYVIFSIHIKMDQSLAEMKTHIHDTLEKIEPKPQENKLQGITTAMEE